MEIRGVFKSHSNIYNASTNSISVKNSIIGFRLGSKYTLETIIEIYQKTLVLILFINEC